DPKTQARMDASVAAMRDAGADIKVAAKTQEAYTAAVAANAGRTGGEEVWRPDQGTFRDSTTAAAGADAQMVARLKDTIPPSVIDAMNVPEGARSAEQKAAVDKWMDDLKLKPDQREQIEEKTRDGLGRGLVITAALATALALAGVYYAS